MAKNLEIQVGVEVAGAPKVEALRTGLTETAQAAASLGDKSGQSAAGLNQANTAAGGLAATSGKLSGGMEQVSAQLANAKSQLMALVGAGLGVQGVKDVTALADSYKNLESRVKLVTGEGAAFDTAFEGVFDVAQRTNSAVEETGLLFSKLAAAGKELGQSNAESLKITETINQSIQLSGSSADASKAAINQLVQGLQSGVLRGDEFNSVMEQAPRLAKALADGLGVTTGELRAMAEAGQLTSDVLIKTLQGQSEVIAAEFGKLPATVGRAMTNLTTEFTRYVGEADQAGGYTATLAGLIDGLAGNLSTVATVAIHTGEVLAGMKLLAMAQDWLVASAAISASATATTAATASTVANTAAKTVNTAATVANARAAAASAVTFDALGNVINRQAKAMTEQAYAANGVAIGFKAAEAPISATARAAGLASGAFGLLARAAAPLIALDIAFHFKEYGTWIGEAAAKLMGYKDRTEELAQADKVGAQVAADNAAQRKRMAEATQAAVEKSFELSKAASASLAEFDKLSKAGSSAAEAVAKIGKDFNLASVAGIRDATAVLDKLAADGKLTATQFQTAWSDALKGADLGVFEVQARAAFAGTAREAERLGQVLDASLRESIKRTGLDFDVISGGMSKASVSAINDTEAMINGLERLKAMGVDTAAALTASLGKGIDTADTQKALDTVRSQIEAVRKALGDKVADGLLDQAAQKAIALGDTLDKATPGITSLREAMKELGVVSDQAFKDTAEKSRAAFDAMKASGSASTRELAEGFRKYAADAIAANGGVATETLKAEAAMRGLEIVTDRAGKAIVRAMGDGKRGVDDFTRSVQTSIGAINQQTTVLEDQARRSADRAKKLQGQNAVDNRLMFQVRDKLDAGTLTAEDTDDVKAVLAALKQNAKINSFGRQMGGISLAGIEDDIKWQNTGAVLQQFVDEQARQTTAAAASASTNTPSNSPAATVPRQVNTPAAQSKTYTVNVIQGGSTTAINTSSDADAQALIGLLQRAKLSA